MRPCLAVLAGAVLLAWPAFPNGYPLLFSDTGGLMDMALLPDIGWDKPWTYGPFLLALHGRTTLWLPALGQCLMLSWLLWTVQRAVRDASAGLHAALCLVLAAGSAAPWFAPLLMPDIFAPMVALCLFVLAFGQKLTRLERTLAALLGTLAIAVHLAHLVLAAGCLALLCLLRWWGDRSFSRPRRLRVFWQAAWRPALPLAAALAWLLLTNAVGNGVLGISPFGSVFMLARLVADGPAAEVIETDCPAAQWRVCAWKGRLPRDSDEFLWHPDGPVWANDKGPLEFAPEASRIVTLAVRRYPLAVLRAFTLNTVRQLALVRVGDVLGPEHLDATILPRLRLFFPPEEVRRYQAALQAQGRLQAWAAPFAPIHLALLGLGLLGTLVVIVLRWRDRALAGLAVLTLGALLANAFSTGALSGPHHRYQARLAWLVLLPPAFAIGRAGRRVSAIPQRPPGTGGPVGRSR